MYLIFLYVGMCLSLLRAYWDSILVDANNCGIRQVITGKFLYPIQKITEIYNKVKELYNFVTKLKNSSWNVLSLLRSEVAYIGTGYILP